MTSHNDTFRNSEILEAAVISGTDIPPPSSPGLLGSLGSKDGFICFPSALGFH